MRVLRLADNKVISENCRVAQSFIDRLRGLMGTSHLPPGNSLLLRPCNSIHTFFMCYPIDVVYLDDNYKILHIRNAMKPWRMDLPVFGAKQVLELPSGGAADLRNGDLLCLS